MNKLVSQIQKNIIPALFFGLFIMILAIFPLEYKALKLKLSLTEWGLPKRWYFYLTDVFILLFGGLCLFKRKKREHFHSASLLFFSLIGAVLFSVLWNFEHYNAIPTMEIISFVIGGILFFSMISHLNEENKKTWTHLFFFGIFLIAMFESFLAFYQYFHQSPIWIRNMAKHCTEEIFHVPGFFVEGGRRWLFDKWLHPIREIEYVIRASGSLGHPNALGGFFLLTLPVSFYLFYQTLSTRMRALFGFGINIQTIALTLTYSRAAIFSWIFIALFWVFMMIRKKTIDHGLPITLKNLRNAFFHSSMKKLTLLLAISLVSSGLFFYEQHMARGGILNYNELSRESDRLRKEDYKAAVTMIKQYPIFGVGYGNFPKVRKEISPTGDKIPSTPVHSMTLLILAENGILGFLLFGLFSLSLLLGALRKSTSPIVITLLSVLVGFSFVGQVDFYLWFSHNGRLLFFLSAAFLLVHERPFSLRELALSYKRKRKFSSTV